MKPQAKRNVYELAQRALEARGYLVIASDREHKPGDVITFETNSSWGLFSSRLVITQETDEQDMVAQDKLLEMNAPAIWGRYIYRTIAE